MRQQTTFKILFLQQQWFALCCCCQVVLTHKHLGIVMSYEAGGDLHSYVQKYKLDETVAR